MKRLLHRSSFIAVCTAAVCAALAPVAAYAQEAANSGTRLMPQSSTLLNAVLSTLLFGFIGIVIAIVGFKLFDLATPFHLESEICEKQNLAAGLLAGCVVLGICIIVAATILS